MILAVLLGFLVPALPPVPRATVERALTDRVELPTGVVLHAVERGDPRGEPVLFLHGFSDTAHSWSGTLDALEALRPDLRLVAVDLRGHGASPLPDAEACAAAPESCFRVVDFAADALAFLDARGIERAHVVGHSLGSLVAQELALTHPGRVRTVTLVGSGARTEGNALVDLLLDDVLEGGAWRRALEARGVAWPAGAYARTPLDADPAVRSWMLEHWVVEVLAPPELLAEIAHETERVPLGTWLGVMRALDRLDHRARLADLAVPTLVVWASGDEVFTTADQAELRDALGLASERHGTRWFWKRYGAQDPVDPRAELGHNPHWAAPGALAADLAAFLRDGGAPTRDLPRADPAGTGRVTLVRDAAEVVAR
jgi:pimeloyl-ACP methyl ester carboxylesterase